MSAQEKISSFAHLPCSSQTKISPRLKFGKPRKIELVILPPAEKRTVSRQEMATEIAKLIYCLAYEN